MFRLALSFFGRCEFHSVNWEFGHAHVLLTIPDGLLHMNIWTRQYTCRGTQLHDSVYILYCLLSLARGLCSNIATTLCFVYSISTQII